MSSSNPNNRSADDVELIGVGYGGDDGGDDIDKDSDNNIDNDSDDSPDDSKHYDGVYYGSSDDDDIDIDIDITDALLGDIGEPDENEEPYDILADNGEFLYSEQDQRPYVATSLDLMSAAEDASSPIMMPISEEEEESEDREEEEGERIWEAAGEEEEVTGTTSSTPAKSDSTSKSREIVFYPGRRAKNRTLQPRSASPSTPMYQMPKDYNIPSKTHKSKKRDNSGESDSEGDSETVSDDDRSNSSSMVAGSIKQLVRDIDGVLNDMRPEGSFDSDDRTDRAANSSYTDDATITSDVSVGATTRLSGELDRAQEVFWEFTGIDATGFRGPRKKKKRKKNKKKRNWLQQPSSVCPPSPPPGEDDNNNGYRRTIGDSKISTIVKLFASYAILIGIFVVVYIMTRNGTKTETSTNSSISDDPTSSVLTTTPTQSQVTDDAFAGNPISLSPEAVTTAPSSSSSSSSNVNVNVNVNVNTIMPTELESTLAPSLRPSKRPPKMIPPTAAPTRKADTSAPTTTPTLPKTIPPTAAPTRKADTSAPTTTPTLPKMIPPTAAPTRKADTSAPTTTPTLPKTIPRTTAPTRKADTSAPTTTPTLPKTIPRTTAPTRKTNTFAPTTTPTPPPLSSSTNLATLPISGKLNGTHDENETKRTQSPTLSSSAKAKDDNEEIEDKDGGEHSFEVPDSSDSYQWDDDDFQPTEFMGEDDFYSNDDAYQYENHHPNGDEDEKDSKQGKHHGNQKVDKGHATKKEKAFKGPKQQQHADTSTQPKQRQWQWQESKPPLESPTIIRESVTRIRKRRNVPRGY
jgi:hypothetical protein